MTLQLRQEGYEEIEILEDTLENDNDNLIASNGEVSRSTYVNKKKRSWVWKYFIKLSEVCFVCVICDERVTVSNTNTARFIKHMFKKHRRVYTYERGKNSGMLNFKKTDIKNDKDLAKFLGPKCLKAIAKINEFYQNNDETDKQKANFEPKIERVIDYNKLEQVPDWLAIYFVKNTEKEYRCNICEILVTTDEKSVELLEHIKNAHKEVYELHKDNPESTVGFQIEFLQFSMLKDDKNHPVILEEVCEETTDEIVKSEKTDKEDLDMQYVLVPRKKKLKRTYEFSRKRSWVWKYFERLTSIIYRCNLCNVVLSIKGCNTNNMNRHVRTRHPGVYKSEVDKKKDFSDIDQLDTSWKKEEESDKDLDESLDILKQRRSWIWSYFRRVSNTLAQCKLCNRNICHGGNATGNMNRHLKMIHNKTADDNNWVWKVFENAEDDFFTCKICQFKCMKFDDVEKSIKCILHHLKNEHGVISGDQIITGTEYEMENPE